PQFVGAKSSSEVIRTEGMQSSRHTPLCRQPHSRLIVAGTLRCAVRLIVAGTLRCAVRRGAIYD
ncbi:MAG: hypothetical protein ACKOOI_04060, partial [Pirellula sp.]